MNTVRIAAAGGLAVMLFAPGLQAQGQGLRPRAPTRVAVTVVLDSTETLAHFRILRRVDQPPLDVIALYGPADAATLSEAVYSLMITRAVQGDTAPRSGSTRVRVSSPDHAPLRTPHYPWAERVIDDLRRAPLQFVTGVGNVRAVEIWLPPQRRAEHSM